ncbi:hypothetical protein KAM621c_32150 [Citrobacter braakii]|uniref:Uncharacterized protein n=1 Tax=Citrobacter braakii TaxID=57706 RepID=A0AAD1P3A9_CITBR|nr:hypothetical protein KAM621c_32150 [Citrobacter braakii]
MRFTKLKNKNQFSKESIRVSALILRIINGNRKTNNIIISDNTFCIFPIAMAFTRWRIGKWKQSYDAAINNSRN